MGALGLPGRSFFHITFCTGWHLPKLIPFPEIRKRKASASFSTFWASVDQPRGCCDGNRRNIRDHPLYLLLQRRARVFITTPPTTRITRSVLWICTKPILTRILLSVILFSRVKISTSRTDKEDTYELWKYVTVKNAWNTFIGNHPKFPRFLRAAGSCISKDTIIEIKVTTAEGRVLETNLKVKESDIDLLKSLAKTSR